MIRIYLDDVRYPTNGHWVVVKNYDQFVAEVEKYGLLNIDYISLDHDLGEQAMKEYFNNVATNGIFNYDNLTEKTGYDACKFLVELSMDTNLPLPRIGIHSANPIGSKNMMDYINNYLKLCNLDQNCKYQPIPHKVLGNGWNDYNLSGD